MSLPDVVTREEWLAARNALLAEEKKLTRAARRAQRRAPPHADGQGREGLRLHRPRRRGEPARPVRGPAAADPRPLHVRPGVGGRLPELLGRRGRDVRGPARAPGRPRHHARLRLARADREDRGLQGAQGLDLPLVLVLRHRLQLRLRRHDGPVGQAARLQLPPLRGRAGRDARDELLPARGRRRLPHELDLRARRRDDRRLVLLPRPHRHGPAGGLGGAEGPRRGRARRAAGLHRPPLR